MPTKAQQQSDTLENIKNQLVKIRDSEALQNVEADSDVAKGLEGVFKGTGNVFSDLQVENGVLTSRSAQQAVDNADKNLRSEKGGSNNNKGGGSKDPMAALMEQNQKLQEAFEREKSTREGLEADKSVADQRAEETANEAAAKAASASKGGDESASTTPSTEGEQTAPEAEQDAFSGIESDDPVVNAQIQNAREQNQLINQQIDTLDDFVDSSEEDTKAMVDSLRSTADRQIQRAEKENARLAQAAQVSGIVAGRGMYSPEEHEGIISETIQEGLDRIGDIENTRNVAIMEAKKAQREFRYEAFVQMSDMVSALSDAKRQAIVDVNTRLNEIEQQEREKQVFDQEQAERNAFILAPELADATPEQIAQTAAANGIDVGLLQREVQTYKDDTRLTELDIEGAELQNQKVSQQIMDMQIERLASGGEDGVEPMSKDVRAQWEARLGDITIPPTFTEDDVSALVQQNEGLTGEALEEVMWSTYSGLNQGIGELDAVRMRGLYEAGDNEEVQTVVNNLAERLNIDEENAAEVFSDQGFQTSLGEARQRNPQAPNETILKQAAQLYADMLDAREEEEQGEPIGTRGPNVSSTPDPLLNNTQGSNANRSRLDLQSGGFNNRGRINLSDEQRQRIEQMINR